jgi:hypothetical protein
MIYFRTFHYSRYNNVKLQIRSRRIHKRRMCIRVYVRKYNRVYVTMFHECYLAWTLPIGTALVTRLPSPARLTKTIVCFTRLAKSVNTIDPTDRLIAKVSTPAFVAHTGVRLITAVAAKTSFFGHTLVASGACPTVEAGAGVGSRAIPVCAVVADGTVAERTFPPFVAVAFESFVAGTIFTAG